jgi:hypothetical protein
MSKKYQVEGFAEKAPRETNRLLSLLALIFTGVGVLLLGIDLFFFMHTQQQITNVLHVQGKVIELVAQGPGEDASVAPKVSFVARNGDTYTFTSSMSTYPPSFQKGQIVELYYDPQNPKEAVIDTFWELWFVNVLLTGLSLPFLGVGLALTWNR